ncbi:uncharacterized protein LOC143300350 [Babylonia areolata]|uniref:uncharacterized protein LOC143300350 n=1 Tax=Babylonia areolata TaxID=304850 RepID=UPI003FD44241
MGNCASSRKTFSRAEPEHAAVLARIRDAQQKYLDENIEGEDDSSDSDSTSDTEEDDDRRRTLSDDTEHAEKLIKKAKSNDDGKIHFERRGRYYSVLDKTDRKARQVDPQDYDYPFQNLVLEGGGNKGIAYCGAVRTLEELGLWPKIRRLAGSSAGAMTASLLAVGYDSYQIEEFLSQDLSQVFLDHKCGYCSLLPNLLTGFGWNPGNRIYKWFGEKLHERCGNADITFKEVMEKFDRELCVVVTNLNQMSTEYCHPKTTPDMAVRLAVRMSMSIPALFSATKYTNHGQTDVFVDGGVLCNYPIHCFDGWWLSMKPEDSFLKRLQPLDHLPRLLDRNERFGSFNEETLGFLLFADNEREVFRYQVETMRHGAQLQDLPNTKLAREKLRKKKLQDKTDREHRRLVKAVNAFLRVLEKHNEDNNDSIDRAELEAALKDEKEFKRKHRLHLFGDVDSDTILEYLDRDRNGQISFQELLFFMEETGINIQLRFLGYQRREVNNFFTFLNTLQSTLLTNVKKLFVEERDIQRTVGINTGHVDTSDFVLEDADRSFLVERGRRACEAFLKYYAAVKDLQARTPPANGVPPTTTPTSPTETDGAAANQNEANNATEAADVTDRATGNGHSQGVVEGGGGGEQEEEGGDSFSTTPPVLRWNGIGANMGSGGLLPFAEDSGRDRLSSEVFEMVVTDEKSPFLRPEEGET